MLDKIWVPDTYFENSKNSNFHSVTVPNKMLMIKPDGTILYNARYVFRELTFFILKLANKDFRILASLGVEDGVKRRR